MNDFVANNNFKVISVNPSQKTVGALNSDILATVARNFRPVEMNIRTMRLKTFVNLVFGINKSVNESFSVPLLVFRIILGAALICFAAISGFATLSSWIATGLAITILFGFQTRIITSLAAIAMIGVSIVKFYPELSIINASDLEILIARIAAGIPLTGIGTLIITAVFASTAVAGPGRYSMDQIIRRKAFCAIKHNAVIREQNRREQLAEDRLSYRAFATND